MAVVVSKKPASRRSSLRNSSKPMNTRLPLFLAASISCLLAIPARGADAPAAKPAQQPAVRPAAPSLPPTFANVAYGTHQRNVLDFYQAKSDKPTPVVFNIHGGGWQAGDKA